MAAFLSIHGHRKYNNIVYNTKQILVVNEIGLIGYDLFVL